MAFRDLISDVDAAVLRDLGDADITLDGQPVEGMFASPWLGPDLEASARSSSRRCSTYAIRMRSRFGRAAS